MSMVPVAPMSTVMVPIEIAPVLSRENDDTRLRSVVPVLSTESQFWPEKLDVSTALRREFCKLA